MNPKSGNNGQVFATLLHVNSTEMLGAELIKSIFLLRGFLVLRISYLYFWLYKFYL